MSRYEYRAIITCSQDPCSYCRQPARRHVPGLSIITGSEQTYDTPEGALGYGLSMNNNVYGSSVHDVTVEKRYVGDWEAEE